jgi:hypothetical protein
MLSEFYSKLVLMFYLHAIMYVNTSKENFMCQARIEILSLQVPHELWSFNRFCNLGYSFSMSFLMYETGIMDFFLYFFKLQFDYKCEEYYLNVLTRF